MFYYQCDFMDEVFGTPSLCFVKCTYCMCCFGLSVELGGLGDEAEDVSPPRRLAKEVSGLVKDGLSQHSKGKIYYKT